MVSLFVGMRKTPDFGSGLFLNTFSQLIFKVKPELKKLAVPANAKYTSAQIQNDVIYTLQTLVKRKISSEVKNSNIFTIMVDG